MSNVKHVPSNADPKKHNDYSLQLSRWFFILIGAWPQTRTSSLIERLSSIVFIPIWSSVVAIITIPGLLYVFFEAKDIQMKLSPLVPLFHRIMGFLNYSILLARGKAIHECIKHMEEDWRVVQKMEDYEVMMKRANMGRYITADCAMFMQGSWFLFNLAATMKTVTIVINNVSTTIHPLSCPAYRKLIDARFSPTNKIMITMQFLSSYLTNSSTVCICSFAIVFTMHASGQLSMLYSWFNEIMDDNTKGNYLVERKLNNIVKHHLRVLCNVDRMAYMTNWYILDHKTARSFILIIMRSNNVIKITAGKIFSLSIATFGDVIKTSLAYMNALQAMSI